jgi:adenine deaminase
MIATKGGAMMAQQTLHWTKPKLREQLAVIRGEKAPTKVLKNATYLNNVLKQWIQANIWICDDRIVYVGDRMPHIDSTTEIIDCSDEFVVPGYIEPHGHPFQLYNPQTFAEYASLHGTTTFINDSLALLLMLPNKKALSLMEGMNHLPYTFYWWCRYDSQTELQNEEDVFSSTGIRRFLNSPYVLQGGELTGWPKVLQGDDFILHWMQETKRLGKKIEGHLPGASEKTLTQMALLGVDCDHEAMTGHDVFTRMSLGYTTSLRYSSIRPDLPNILSELKELGVNQFDRITMTTDGSTPVFYKNGVTDTMIDIALKADVPDVDAYAMASYNIARHYGMDDLQGMIAPGRIANLNILTSKSNPTPISVISKGEWIKKKEVAKRVEAFNWSRYDINQLKLDWELTLDDMNFTMPVGIEMVKSVITKPYNIKLETATDQLDYTHDESFLIFFDKHGKWHINTIVKGFATGVSGFASSFSNSGDLIIIGKNKQDMLKAFRRMKEMGGGIVLAENEEVISEIKLPLGGAMSLKPMEDLMAETEGFVKELRDRGYRFADPIYSLLFFSSTHLPYIRVTQNGLFDVKNKTVLFPSIMR